MKTRLAHLTRLAATTLLVGATAAGAQAPLPHPQERDGVTYLSGGVGDEEIQAIKAAMKDYPLALMFSRAGGDYVANVAVTIKDAKGATAFEIASAGPYLLVKLPSGKYSVTASYQNESKTRPVSVDRNAKAPVAFVWK